MDSVDFCAYVKRNVFLIVPNILILWLQLLTGIDPKAAVRGDCNVVHQACSSTMYWEQLLFVMKCRRPGRDSPTMHEI